MPLFLPMPRGDAPPMPPFSSGDGLDEKAPPRPPVQPAPFSPGDRVNPKTLTVRPETYHVGWPVRLWEVTEVENLRWHEYSSTYHALAWDSVIVGREVEAWRHFGPYGEHVPELLEGIWRLTKEQVMTLDVDPDVPRFHVAWDGRLTPPKNGPLAAGVAQAGSSVRQWIESRGWSVDDNAGSHFYSGCYFIYNLVEPHWLVAFGAAHAAAVALAMGPTIEASLRRDVLARWSRITGEPSIDGTRAVGA